ncbi:MAG: hypothetical protein ACE5GX_08605 [Thermoanaerobaculia bacterium]
MNTGRRSRILLTAAALALGAVMPAVSQTVSNGQTASGAHYVFVVPDAWNGDLAIWNHGFSLDPPGPVSADAEDISRIVQLAAPFNIAVAASSYSQSGWALFKTNVDLEQMVTAFEDEFGVPNQVIVTGASLGGIVTASALEKANLGDVTGALTLCGAMAGSRNWDGGLDLRLVYDAVCDVKKARIPGGPKGLEKNSTLTDGDVVKAVNKCFGLNRKKPKKKQKKRLDKFLEVTGIPAEFVEVNMLYVTFAMADLVYDRKKMKGKQGASNDGVDYGDAGINADIERFKAKKSKAKRLDKFYTPNGKVGDVKIVSIHTDKDGLVIVENQSEYASVVPPENLTVAVVVEDTSSHCQFSNAELVGAWEALRGWIGGNPQPTVEVIQTNCEALAPVFGGPCRFDPDFVIPDMDGRIRPR